jgi:hypothetical protein
MCLHDVENLLLEVFKHGDLHCVVVVGNREVTLDTGNVLQDVEFS